MALPATATASHDGKSIPNQYVKTINTDCSLPMHTLVWHLDPIDTQPVNIDK